MQHTQGGVLSPWCTDLKVFVSVICVLWSGRRSHIAFECVIGWFD